jgi:hypothetical protein
MPVFPDALYALYDERYLKKDGSNYFTGDILPDADGTRSLGSTIKKWLKGWFHSIAVTNIDGNVNVENIYPKTDNTYVIGSASKRVADAKFVQLTLGGVSRTSWPTVVAGSNGNVFYSGTITLAGQDGVTVTHNKGDTSYIAKVMPRDITPLGSVGDISVVRAANTVTVYNSGFSGGAAEIEISNIA